MKGIIFFLCGSFFSIFGSFCEVHSESELLSLIQSEKECIFAVGAERCIPCDRVKKLLLESQEGQPPIYWIDLKKIPSARHVFNFKAIPYLEVYKDGERLLNLCGENGCRNYLNPQ